METDFKIMIASFDIHVLYMYVQYILYMEPLNAVSDLTQVPHTQISL